MKDKNGDNSNGHPPDKKRSLFFWLMIITLSLLMYSVLNSASRQQEMDYSSFVKDVGARNVEHVVLSRNRMALAVYRKAQSVGGNKQTAENAEQLQSSPPQPELKKRFVNLPSVFVDGGHLHQKLEEAGVTIAASNAEPSFLMAILSWIFPVLILAAVWIYFMKKNPMFSGGISNMMTGSFKKRLLNAGIVPNVKFADIAGCDEAKEDLQEFVEFLKNPLKFRKLGGKIPKGVLLTGPPGCGKTLLAKAVAGEAKVSFFSLSGSDFVEMFVGMGAARVRELFETAKKSSPAIIFMDEIDAVGRHRGAGLGGGHDEREQTLNQLLVELDGFDTSSTVVLLAATNRPDILDPALLRSGRFDRQVVVPRPDVRGRQKILEIYAEKIAMSKNVRLEIVARSTPGLSGADLKNIVNEAAIFATRDGSNKVEQKHFNLAVDKILTGQERKSAVISPREKEIVAHHEAGHALVAAVLPGTDPLHKVSIIPRGMTLGITQQIPEEDMHLYSRTYLLNRLAVLMAGREAELERFSGEPSTGASDDIEKATEMARRMVTKWGMSEVMGPVAYGESQEMIFLGRSFNRQQNYSEATAHAIDSEIKRIIEEASSRAKNVLQKHHTAFLKISARLKEDETLFGDEIKKIINENPPH